MRKIKLLLSLVSLLSLASSAVRAQFSGNPNVNAVVRDTTGLNSSENMIATAPNGKSFIVFTKPNPGSGLQIRMQLIDSNGVRQWDPAGILVDSLIGSSTSVADLKTDKDGNAIYVATDARNYPVKRPVMYKIDQNGNFLWGANGIQLVDTTNNASFGGGANVCITDSNNVVVTYYSQGTSKVYVTFNKYSPAGVPIWDNQKRIIDLTGSNMYLRPKLISTGGEGFILAYVRGLGFGTMYAQKYDGSGTALWPAPVRISNKTVGTQYSISLSTDGYGGAFVTFTGGKPSSNTLNSVYGQRVYADGHLWDSTGKQLILDYQVIYTQQFDYGNVYARSNNSYFAYMQLVDASNSSLQAVAMQKLDTAGNRMFDSLHALVIVPMAMGANVPNPVSLKVTDSSLVSVYTTGPNTASPFITQIFAKKLSFSGANLWTTGPVALSTVSSNKGKVTAGDYSHNQIVVCWNDARLTGAPTGTAYVGGVYVQNLRADSLRGVICPNITMDTLADRLITDSAFALGCGHPSGGVYSGTGVTNGVFDPAAAGLGTFTIKYVYSAYPCLDSATTTITVKCPHVTMDSLSTITRDHGPVTLTGGHPAGGVYSGTGVTNGVFDPIEAGVGTFTISYIYDAPPCHDTATTTITVIQPSGVRNVNAQELFECYPNPATGKFVIALKQNMSGNVTVRVTGVDGRELMSETYYSNGKYTRSFDVSHLARGIYIVEVSSPSGVASAKLMLQ